MTTLWQVLIFFFFNDTATTEIYTLSLHDALPIYGLSIKQVAMRRRGSASADEQFEVAREMLLAGGASMVYHFMSDEDVERDRKSTRLNSSHDQISYAVFCLKKKKQQMTFSELVMG